MESTSDSREENSGTQVWLAMLGINPGIGNLAAFGDTKGVYVWVAGRAQTADEFRQVIDAETSRRGLRVNEIADVMPAEIAFKREAQCRR